MKSSLILIFGLPRSGTTWIGKCIDSHPDVRYFHEPDSWRKPKLLPVVSEEENCPEYQESIIDFIRSFTSIKSPNVLGKMPVFPKSYLNIIQYKLLQMSVFAAKTVGRLPFKYSLPVLRAAGSGASQPVIWKSILSVGNLGMINRSLSGNCRGVLLIRHPCGQINSVIRGAEKNKFSLGTELSKKYQIFEMLLRTKPAMARGITMEDIRNMTIVERLACRWMLLNEKAMMEARELDNWITVLYDDFAEAPEVSARKLFDFMGLSWTRQTQEFLNRSVSVDVPTYYSVFKDPGKAANKWKDALSREQIGQISRVAGNSMPGRLFKYPL